MKTTFVLINKPLEVIRIESTEGPSDWYRLDILKNKLKVNKAFRSKFSKEELNQIEALE